MCSILPSYQPADPTPRTGAPRVLSATADRLPAHFAAVLVVLAVALPAMAHERHPVEARLHLEPGRYTLSMPFDVPALMLSRTLNHTDAEEAARELLALPSEDRERAFAQAERFLRLSLRIEIDGERSSPVIELPSFEPGPLGRLGDPRENYYVRMSGDFPTGSRAMTLTPGRALREWTLVPIAMDGRRLPALTLTGGITGPPISLEMPPPPPPLRRVFADHLVAGADATALLATLPLFLLGMLLLHPRAGTMAAQALAFTPGVLLALGLAAFGVLSVPPPVVDATMALSVLTVAVEGGLTGRPCAWRPALLFGAGLCFGHGLADALAVESAQVQRTGAAFAGWATGFLIVSLGMSLPLAVVLLAAERRGLMPRFRLPLMYLTALLGFGGLVLALRPFFP